MRPSPLSIALFFALLPASTTFSAVVINEIFYHAPDELENLEWIELHNPDAASVDLSGWKFSEGVDFRFPEKSVLPPGGFLVLCKNRTLFADYYDATIAGEFKGSLSNGGETLELVDAQGKPVDRVTYSDRDPWPLAADGMASSLERITPGSPGDRAWNWSASPPPEDMERPAGTPGKLNASHSAHLPPVISKITVNPQQPLPGQPIRIEATVDDPNGVPSVEVLYRVAQPGSMADEKVIAMPTIGNGRFAAEIPGQEASRLVRLRVHAINAKNAERYAPSPNDLRPALSLYVQNVAESAGLALAEIVTPDADEFARMERLRRHSLEPNKGPFQETELQKLQETLQAGMNLPETWFEWTVRQPLDQATYQRLRAAFVALKADSDAILERSLAAPDTASQLKVAPATIQTFQATLADRLQAALPETRREAYDAWQRKQRAQPAGGPESFFRRLMDLEGAWLALNVASEFTGASLERIRPALKTAADGRAEAATKMMRGELDFGKLQEALGAIGKTLEVTTHPLLTTRQLRSLDAWRNAQGSPIRPRLGVAKPRTPRGNSAFIVTDTRSGIRQVFDFVHVTERSAGYRVRFHKDQPWNGMTSAAVIFEYNDRFVLAEPLAFELYRRLGNAACQTDFVRLAMNGHTLGYHLVIEQVNNAFLRRNRLHPDGDLYKILWYGSGIEGQHEKQNHPDHDHTKLREVIASLESTSGADQWALIQKNFDVPQVINYFAANSVLSHWDGFFNNYFTYRGPNPNDRWLMFPWDQDKTWGFHDASGQEVFFDMPLTFGMAGDRPPGGGEPGFNPGHWWRPGGFFSKPLLANPEFRKLYLQRVRQILEDVYTEKVFFPIIDSLAQRLKPEVILRARAMGEDPEQASARLTQNIASLKEHLVKRRKFLLEQEELLKLPR